MDNIATKEINVEYLKRFIYCIRGVRVMLDMDLAEIYGYSTNDFMFRLTDEENEKVS